MDRAAGAMYGLFIGDALAMPVHWYYNTKALEKDYGHVKDFMKPRNPHPDSILWRSSYNPQTKVLIFYMINQNIGVSVEYIIINFSKPERILSI